MRNTGEARADQNSPRLADRNQCKHPLALERGDRKPHGLHGKLIADLMLDSDRGSALSTQRARAHLLARQRNAIHLLHRRPPETNSYSGRRRNGARPRYLKASGIAVVAPATGFTAGYRTRDDLSGPPSTSPIFSTGQSKTFVGSIRLGLRAIFCGPSDHFCQDRQ